MHLFAHCVITKHEGRKEGGLLHHDAPPQVVYSLQFTRTTSNAQMDLSRHFRGRLLLRAFGNWRCVRVPCSCQLRPWVSYLEVSCPRRENFMEAFAIKQGIAFYFHCGFFFVGFCSHLAAHSGPHSLFRLLYSDSGSPTTLPAGKEARKILPRNNFETRSHLPVVLK